MSVYIACGLTHVPRAHFARYTGFIHSLAGALSSSGDYNVKYALRDSDPQLADKPFEERARLCYLWDREMVESADLVIGEASYPSIGLGMELQLAEAKGIPVILTFRRVEEHRAEPVEYVNPDATHHMLQIGEGFVTLMALGLPTLVRLVAYESEADGIRQLVEAAGMFRHP